MRGTRGYSSYRGRLSKWKIALAVFLVLVILAATASLFLMQDFVVYDDTGTPHFKFPGGAEEMPPQELPVDTDLIIEQQPEPQVEKKLLQGTLLQSAPLQADAPDLTGAAGSKALAVTLKEGSVVYFDTAAAVRGAVKLQPDTMETLQAITAGDAYTIARLGCFHDSKAANADVEGMGLKNTGGFIFYDGTNTQWLDPAKPEARSYLCALAAEVAQLGFDEIVLTEVSYPTEGKLDKVAYGETAKEENLRTFLQEMREALAEYDVELAIEVPAAVIAQGQDAVSGLVLRDVADTVDVLYAAVSPEEIADCTEKAEAVGCVFIPVLTQIPAGYEGNYLLRTEILK